MDISDFMGRAAVVTGLVVICIHDVFGIGDGTTTLATGIFLIVVGLFAIPVAKRPDDQ